MKEDKDKQKENQAQQPAVDAILSQTNIDGQTVVAEHHVAGKAEEGNGKDKDKAKKAESQAERDAEDLRVFKKVIKAQAHEGDGQAPQTLTLRKILGGDILNTNFMRNQIGVLLLITFFLIIFIANRYSVQQDLIKIDMGFLRDFDPGARSNEVLASVIDMIKRMGTGSLIEGVETQEQLDFVSAVGCEFIQGYLFGKPRPLEWYVAHLDEYQVERIESRGYYDSISRVNPVSPVPFDYDGIAGKAEKGMVSSIALAVVELRGKAVSYLWANRAYEEALATAGHASLEQSARWVNEKRGDIRRFLAHTATAGELRTLDFMGGGQHFLLRGKALSAGAGSAAVLVSLTGIVEAGEHESVGYDTVAEYLLSTFSRVDLIDLRTREIRNVYLGRTLAGSREYLETTEDEAKDAVSALVYSADRERYLEFCDLDTIEQRMSLCPEPYLADVFRMRNDAGLFSWNELVVVPLQLGGRAYVISAVRQRARRASAASWSPMARFPTASCGIPTSTSPRWASSGKTRSAASSAPTGSSSTTTAWTRSTRSSERPTRTWAGTWTRSLRAPQSCA